jgi:hypothetical protein
VPAMPTDRPRVFYADDPPPGPDVKAVWDGAHDIYHQTPSNGLWHGLFPPRAISWSYLQIIAEGYLEECNSVPGWEPYRPDLTATGNDALAGVAND